MYHCVIHAFPDTSEPRDTRDDGHEPKPLPAASDDTEGSDAGAERDNRKERVLHTRVPAVLERELKRFAESMRIPVSNLVRTILEDALNVADAASEGVEERLKKAATQLEHERDRIRKRLLRDPLADVYAFQPVKLAQDALCAKCKKELARGERVHLGLTEEPRPRGAPRIFVCDACLPSE
jgi:hypothetical protein